MKELMQKIKNIIPVIVGAATLDGYRRTVLADMARDKLQTTTNSLEVTSRKIEKLQAELVYKKQNIDIYDAGVEASQSRIEELLKRFRSAYDKAQEYHQEGNDNMFNALMQEINQYAETLKTEIEDLAVIQVRKSIKLENVMNSIVENSNSNQLWNNYWENINSLFSDMSTAQLGAIGHILLAIGIYYCVVNIATAYYGDKLITYFKLEQKFPRLAKFIKYRRIYQEYNIAFNLILILGIAAYIIFVNVSVYKYI